MRVLLIIFIFLTGLPACSFITGEIVIGPGGITEHQAKSFANRYLASSNLQWGEPIRVQFSANKFLLHYDTPSEESTKFGRRTLSVDIKTGAVSYPLRLFWM